jgi:cytoskeletal protein CcmA (bactofilin family)
MISTVPLHASDTPRQTIVEEGTDFSGTLESRCPIVVNGTIQGKVRAPEITVRRLGSVSGVIMADRLTSSGTLSGRIDATHVRVTGRVCSQTIITATRLEVMLRSERGQLEVTFGAPTAKPEASGTEPPPAQLPGGSASSEPTAPGQAAPSGHALERNAVSAAAAPDDSVSGGSPSDGNPSNEAAERRPSLQRMPASGKGRRGRRP